MSEPPLLTPQRGSASGNLQPTSPLSPLQGQRRNSLKDSLPGQKLLPVEHFNSGRRGSLNSQLTLEGLKKLEGERLSPLPLSPAPLPGKGKLGADLDGYISPLTAMGGLKNRRMSKSFSNLTGFNQQREKSAAARPSSVMGSITDLPEPTPETKKTVEPRRTNMRREKSVDSAGHSEVRRISSFGKDRHTPSLVDEALEMLKAGKINFELGSQKEEQPDADVKLVSKLSRLSQNISAITDKTRVAREELQRMTDITKELKNQCGLQELECHSLETDQVKVKEEMDMVSKRMETLLAEKKGVEARLEQLRAENAKLEEFLENHKRGAPV